MLFKKINPYISSYINDFKPSYNTINDTVCISYARISSYILSTNRPKSTSTLVSRS